MKRNSLVIQALIERNANRHRGGGCVTRIVFKSVPSKFCRLELGARESKDDARITLLLTNTRPNIKMLIRGTENLIEYIQICVLKQNLKSDDGICLHGLFCRCPSLRSCSNCLVGSLALADFLMMLKSPIFIIQSFQQGPTLGSLGRSPVTSLSSRRIFQMASDRSN